MSSHGSHARSTRSGDKAASTVSDACISSDSSVRACADQNSEGPRIPVAKNPKNREAMSGFVGQRSRPWVGMAGGATPSEPGDARDDAAAASSMQGPLGAGASTSASAISFGFAATAVLVSMFLLMAIFEHLIKPGLSSSSSSSSGSRGDGSGDDRDGGGVPRTGRWRPQDGAAPDKLGHSPKVEAVVAMADLTVLMPGQRYPTFLAQPAPLQPCPREGVRWPPHEQLEAHHHHSFLPP